MIRGRVSDDDGMRHATGRATGAGPSALHLGVVREQWRMSTPLRMNGYLMQETDVIVATLSDGVFAGRGEAIGVFYLGDTSDRMVLQLEAVREVIEAGISRADLRRLMPPGGARNAVDCAMWELESKRSGSTIEEMAGLPDARPLLTTCTIGADSPETMARTAAEKYRNAQALKLKLLGDVVDAERVRRVRAARPNVWMGVDANQAYDVERLDALLPVLSEARVALIEQPFQAGEEGLMDKVRRVIPFAADESAQTLEDVACLVGRFDVVNIKLDKCGGLTEALLMMAEVQRLGMRAMVGNMGGTSLAMAPALILGQGCDVVDLDGPLFLATDRVPGVSYRNGLVSGQPGVWGWARPGT